MKQHLARKKKARDLLPTEPPRVIRPPGPGNGLEHLGNVVVNVLELLALLEVTVREPAAAAAAAGLARGDLPVAAPCEGEAGDTQEAAGDAVAQGGGVLGDCVEGEVLAVAAAVAAPDGDDDEGEDEEEDEGDDGGNDESLFGFGSFCVVSLWAACYNAVVSCLFFCRAIGFVVCFAEGLL